MLRFLHCADVHLDTPFSLEDLDNADVRRAQLRSAISSMMLYIRQMRVDLLLIAGDLFGHAFLTRETAAFLRREFASVPDCHIVIAPGNHDFYTQDSIYSTTDFSDNVHIFRDDVPSCFSFTVVEEDGMSTPVEVWGFANTAPAMNGYEVLNGVRFGEKTAGTYRFFVGHAALAGSRCDDTASDVPLIRKEQLAAGGFDYCALGHYHTSDGIRRMEAKTVRGNVRTTYFSYAGCLVGRGFEECGARGAVCGTLGFDENGDTAFSVRRLRMARRRYECLDVCLDDVPDAQKTDTALPQVFAQALAQAVADKKMAAPDKDTALRLTVTGTLGAHLLLSEQRIAEALAPLSSLVLIDRTVTGETASLESDPTLRGAYLRTLADKLQSEDATMRETAALALRLGMQEFKNE
ncbi:MAG: metallophosphoesterase [Clostridia bacterium]|nr:metallophosphoesterase [Clostridia bacterium]